MTSPLVARTALLCRSAFAKPALFNTVRFSSSSSSEKNDVIVLENEPVLSVENLSGAPGKKKNYTQKREREIDRYLYENN